MSGVFNRNLKKINLKYPVFVSQSYSSDIYTQKKTKIKYTNKIESIPVFIQILFKLPIDWLGAPHCKLIMILLPKFVFLAFNLISIGIFFHL